MSTPPLAIDVKWVVRYSLLIQGDCQSVGGPALLEECPIKPLRNHQETVCLFRRGLIGICNLRLHDKWGHISHRKLGSCCFLVISLQCRHSARGCKDFPRLLSVGRVVPGSKASSSTRVLPVVVIEVYCQFFTSSRKLDLNILSSDKGCWKKALVKDQLNG